MLCYFTFLVFAFLATFQLSDEHPIAVSRFDQGMQNIRAKNPAYLPQERFGGRDVDLLTGEGEDDGEGMEGDQDLQELSPETVDTIHKINPLTIADQVSQIFRNGVRQKASIANKSSGGFGGSQRNLIGGILEDQSLARSTGPEGEEIPMQPGYIRQEVPRIVSKPRSNDYGYSVIVLAGDPVNLPIKVQGKTVRGKGREFQEEKDGPVSVQGQEVYKTGDAEEKVSLKERSPKKEFRVYKKFSKNPDFPVYDEDFSFIPDPFHGILDDNYKNELKKDRQKSDLSMEDFRLEDGGLGLHRIYPRSGEVVGGGDAEAGKAACGTWGKGNATGSEALSPLGFDDNNNN